MDTLDLLKRVSDLSNKPYAAWTLTQQNPRGVPRYFHAHFIAIAQLLHDEHLVPKSVEDLAAALKGFWDRDLAIPAGGNWGSSRKIALIDSVKGALRPSFKPSEDERDVQIREQAIRFESTLSMALTEKALFELKQGFCRVDDPANFDSNSFDKMLRTASAMANTGPDAHGVIYIGVADNFDAAQRIEHHTGILPKPIDCFHVTGTQHELDAMNRTVDQHFRWLIDKIRTSKLDKSFAARLAATLKPFRYDGYLIWSLEPSGTSTPVTFDSNFYQRVGPRTDLVSNPQALIELVQRFPSRES